MAEYYSNSISRNKRRKRWSYSRKELLLLLLDLFMTLAMALLVFCSVSVIACQYVSPEKSGFLSIISLGAPIIYLLDLVVMFYWIMRWRWYRASVMIVVVGHHLCVLSLIICFLILTLEAHLVIS